jgi:hypothetical protein
MEPHILSLLNAMMINLFLETSSRVGRPIMKWLMPSNINLWNEWAIGAKVKEKYKLPKVKKEYTGIV